LSIFYIKKTLVIVTKEKRSSISLFIVEKHFMVARMGQEMFSLKPIITTLLVVDVVTLQEQGLLIWSNGHILAIE